MVDLILKRWKMLFTYCDIYILLLFIITFHLLQNDERVHCLDEWIHTNNHKPLNNHSNIHVNPNTNLRRLIFMRRNLTSHQRHPSLPINDSHSLDSSETTTKKQSDSTNTKKETLLKRRRKYSEIPNHQSEQNFIDEHLKGVEVEGDNQYDEYIEDSPEFVESTSPSPNNNVQLPNASQSTSYTSFSSENNNPDRFLNNIEKLVRSQINLGASNWATLKPVAEEDLLGSEFNDSIQHLASYLSNSTALSVAEGNQTKSPVLELDHAIPEESATDVSCVQKGLFHPNHNYRFEHNESSPFLQLPIEGSHSTQVAVESAAHWSSTLDPMTVSSDESNKYGSIPILTTEPSFHSDPMANMPSQPAPTDVPRNRNMIVDRTRGEKQHAKSRLRVYPEKNHYSEFVYTNSHSINADPQVDPEVSSHSSTSGDEPLVESIELGINKQRPYKLRPTQISNNGIEKETYLLSENTQLHLPHSNSSIINKPLNINGSLALRLNANRYKNWPLTNKTLAKSSMIQSQLEQPPTFELHKQLQASKFAGVNPQPGSSYFHQAKNNQLPIPTPQSLFNSGISQPRFVLPFSNTATTPSFSMTPLLGSSSTLSMSSSSPQPNSVTPGKILQLSSNNLMANSSSPSGRSVGSRFHRRPAQHHHHSHSHIHSIKPALISIPVPVPSKVIQHSYDSLLTAAAAAAALANNQNRLARQQVLAQSLLSQALPGFEHHDKLVTLHPAKKPSLYIRPTIPIGGTLASTRNNLLKGQPNSLLPLNLQSTDAITTTTYQSTLLNHLLDTANRALKQVAGNTANLFNLRALTQSSHPTHSVSRGTETKKGSSKSRDYFDHQLEPLSLYQAASLDELPSLDAYLASLLTSAAATSPESDLFRNSNNNNKFKEESSLILSEFKPISSASSNVFSDSAINELGNNGSTKGDSKNEVVFASLDDQSNLLYPILTSSHLKGSQANSVSSMHEASDQSSVIFSENSPVWSKQLDSYSGRRIPLSKHANSHNNPSDSIASFIKQSKHNGSVSSSDDNHHVKPKKAQSLANQEQQQHSDQMPYAVTHYIGELANLKAARGSTGSTGDQSTGHSINAHQLVQKLRIPTPRPNDPIIYDISDDKLTTKYSFDPLDLLPFTTDTFNTFQASNSKIPSVSKFYDTLLTSGDLDQLYKPAFVLANSDLTSNAALFPPKYSNSISSDIGIDSKKNHGIRSVNDDEYRANESKNQEQVVHIMSQSALNPGNDPIQQILHLAASSVKPHLTAASDLVNYHKLRFLDHYLQYHLLGTHDYPTSESARLAVGGSHHKSHLLLHYWPLALALLPIMIIVAIVVQLLLAAPLVLFAMTTLTVARLLANFLSPLFGREDPFNYASSTNVKSFATPRVSTAPTIPHTNFLYSILKLHSGSPTSTPRTNSSIVNSTNSSNKSKSSSSSKRRRKRHLESPGWNEADKELRAFEEYFESLFR